jgi:flagellar protein FlbD
MIKVTRLNDSVMVINVEKIQTLQATPDTVITFTNHDKIMVKEPIEEISRRIVDYQRAVNNNLADDVSDHRSNAGGAVSVEHPVKTS